MNKVVLIGRLTRDPVLSNTQSGRAVCTFTLAVDKNFSNEKRREAEAANRPTADFPRITVWGRQAENVARYLSKGSQCAVDGRIQTGSYEKDGRTIYTTDVVADNVEFLGGRSDNNRSNQGSFAGDNQDYYSNDYSQVNNSYNNQGNNNNQTNDFSGNDDFFDDDFTEIQDDGRIPF